MTIVLLSTTILFAALSAALAWQASKSRSGRDRRLEELGGRLDSLNRNCLTDLGAALEAMRDGDYSLRLEPKTDFLPAPSGATSTDDLVRTFNEMLGRAQGGLMLYNDLAAKNEQLMGRLDLLSGRLDSMRTVCLTGLGGALGAMRDGDLTQRVHPGTKHIEPDSDDIEVIARLIDSFNDMLSMAQGGLGAYNDVADQWTDLVAQLADAVARLGGASEQLSANAREVGRTADEIAGAVGELAAGAERQVVMLDDTRVVADRAQEASASAHERTGRGLQTMGETGLAMDVLQSSSEEVLQSMRTLAEKSHQIGGIVDSISGIADQTNLLALNAAIEAARAGDQGRGFAVVADEVRKLAEESQGAAQRIAGILADIGSSTSTTMSLVEQSVERTADGIRLVDEARAAFSAIESAVADVVEGVSRISSAAHDVAAVATESSASTEEVSASTEETAASMQEVSAASVELGSLSERLSQITGRFRIDAQQSDAAISSVVDLREAA